MQFIRRSKIAKCRHLYSWVAQPLDLLGFYTWHHLVKLSYLHPRYHNICTQIDANKQFVDLYDCCDLLWHIAFNVFLCFQFFKLPQFVAMRGSQMLKLMNCGPSSASVHMAKCGIWLSVSKVGCEEKRSRPLAGAHGTNPTKARSWKPQVSCPKRKENDSNFIHQTKYN